MTPQDTMRLALEALEDSHQNIPANTYSDWIATPAAPEAK